MSPRFSFKVTNKKRFRLGVLVIGQITCGGVAGGDDLLVRVGSNEYKATVDSLIDLSNGRSFNYYAGKGKLGIYLPKFDYDVIKPGKTIMESIDAGKEPVPEPPVNPSTHQTKEKEFIEDIKVCLKDGGRISPSEFFVLDKIRNALSIPSDRAKALVSRVCKDYNDKQNEIEYQDAVSLCLMDSNYISDTERYLLERLRLSLNISQQRAYEIEEDSKWILTE